MQLLGRVDLIGDCSVVDDSDSGSRAARGQRGSKSRSSLYGYALERRPQTTTHLLLG
jgi:ribosomal protein L15